MSHSTRASRPFNTLLCAIEHELDRIWPGYVHKPDGSLKGSPFNQRPIHELARIKWLLKRHWILTGPSGKDPQGKAISTAASNRAVKIAYDDKDNPLRCWAHPLDVEHCDTKYPGPLRVDGVFEAVPVKPVEMSAGQIAVRLGRPLDDIEEALFNAPEGADRLVWCQSYEVRA